MKHNKLKTKIFYFAGIIVYTLLPEYTHAGSTEAGLSIESYTVIVFYGFIAFLLILFTYLIYHATGNYVEPVSKAGAMVIPAQQTSNAEALHGTALPGAAFPAAALRGLNIIYYSVFILIALYIIMFMISMF